ncbi:hypothetical protein QE152_g50 [Popillia japonica]|uniref:Uncharacterized protein n=1 Tax=Popillia japonica TaxID=7064 RepID=A0AAW1NKS0_POPJA
MVELSSNNRENENQIILRCFESNSFMKIRTIRLNTWKITMVKIIPNWSNTCMDVIRLNCLKYSKISPWRISISRRDSPLLNGCDTIELPEIFENISVEDQYFS